MESKLTEQDFVDFVSSIQSKQKNGKEFKVLMVDRKDGQWKDMKECEQFSEIMAKHLKKQ